MSDEEKRAWSSEGQVSLQELVQTACRAAVGGPPDVLFQAHSLIKRKAPKSAEARLLTGAVHLVRWHPGKVLKIGREVIAANPDTTTSMAAHIFCGLAFLQLALQAGALQASEAALRVQPGAIEGECLKALALVILTDYHQALELLSHWMLTVEEISPPSFGLQFLLLTGRAYTELHQGHQAMEIAMRCLRLFPSSSRAYVLKARTHFSLNQDKETLQACDQALALAQIEEEAWLYKTVALTRLGRYEESLPAYTWALLLFSGTAPRRSVEVYMGIVVAFKGLKCYKQALKARYLAYAIASRIPMRQKTRVNLQQDIIHIQQMLLQQQSPGGDNAPHLLIALVGFLFSLAGETSMTMSDDLLSCKSKI